MNIKTLKSLKEGDMVICIESLVVSDGSTIFTKNKVYKIGGKYWNKYEKEIKELKRKGFVNQRIGLTKNDQGDEDGWVSRVFIKITNKDTAKVLFGDDDET